MTVNVPSSGQALVTVTASETNAVTATYQGSGTYLLTGLAPQHDVHREVPRDLGGGRIRDAIDRGRPAAVERG